MREPIDEPSRRYRLTRDNIILYWGGLAGMFVTRSL